MHVPLPPHACTLCFLNHCKPFAGLPGPEYNWTRWLCLCVQGPVNHHGARGGHQNGRYILVHDVGKLLSCCRSSSHLVWPTSAKKVWPDLSVYVSDVSECGEVALGETREREEQASWASGTLYVHQIDQFCLP